MKIPSLAGAFLAAACASIAPAYADGMKGVAAVAAWQNPATGFWAWGAVSGRPTRMMAAEGALKECRPFAGGPHRCRIIQITDSGYQTVGLCFYKRKIVKVVTGRGETAIDAYGEALDALGDCRHYGIKISIVDRTGVH